VQRRGKGREMGWPFGDHRVGPIAMRGANDILFSIGYLHMGQRSLQQLK
jgi:hypothetical protein